MRATSAARLEISANEISKSVLRGEAIVRENGFNLEES